MARIAVPGRVQWKNAYRSIATAVTDPNAARSADATITPPRSKVAWGIGERERLVGPEKPGEGPKENTEPDGGRDQDEGGLVGQGAHDHALDEHAEQGGEHQRQGQRAQGGQSEPGHEREVDVGAHHHELALRQVAHLGGFVDEHEAQGHQGVDAALGQSRHRCLQQ
jgi:hypothetical protein